MIKAISFHIDIIYLPLDFQAKYFDFYRNQKKILDFIGYYT